MIHKIIQPKDTTCHCQSNVVIIVIFTIILLKKYMWRICSIRETQYMQYDVDDYLYIHKKRAEQDRKHINKHTMG